MLDDMKAGNHVEVSPWRAFDDIAMHRSDDAGFRGQFRVGFDTKNIERGLRDTQEIAAGTPNLEQLSRRLVPLNETQTPSGIQLAEAMLFQFRQMPKGR